MWKEGRLKELRLIIHKDQEAGGTIIFSPDFIYSVLHWVSGFSFPSPLGSLLWGVEGWWVGLLL